MIAGIELGGHLEGHGFARLGLGRLDRGGEDGILRFEERPGSPSWPAWADRRPALGDRQRQETDATATITSRYGVMAMNAKRGFGEIS